MNSGKAYVTRVAKGSGPPQARAPRVGAGWRASRVIMLRIASVLDMTRRALLVRPCSKPALAVLSLRLPRRGPWLLVGHLHTAWVRAGEGYRHRRR